MLVKSQFNRAVALAVLGSVFLSSGLIINSLLAWKGNNWAWTASLRFLLLIPVLALLVLTRNGLTTFWTGFKKLWQQFVLYGCLGFGIYYGLLSFAVKFVPGWLVTAAFMTTVLAGMLIAPFIYDDQRAVISKKALLLSSFIVTGLFVMQIDHFRQIHYSIIYVIAIIMSLLAAVLWPLGNRKILFEMEKSGVQLDSLQRVLGMAIGSLPVLTGLAMWGYHQSGLPDQAQLLSSLAAVILAGVVGFALYFKAFQMVKNSTIGMATIESTQITSVVFTLMAEMVFKGIRWPGLFADLGLAILFCSLCSYYYLTVKSLSVKLG